MIIDRLPTLPSAPTTGDELAIERGTGTYKVGFDGLAGAVIDHSPIQLQTATAISIPAPGSSVSYSMPGLTANHVLTYWNFSASAENNPPADLTWTTYAGYFTITNNGGTTSESIKPIFELPRSVSITAR